MSEGTHADPGSLGGLVTQLAQESFGFDATSRDPERNCWMVVHRHVHGVLPSEYDIRATDELLYLAVLARRRALTAGAASGLS